MSANDYDPRLPYGAPKHDPRWDHAPSGAQERWRELVEKRERINDALDAIPDIVNEHRIPLWRAVDEYLAALTPQPQADRAALVEELRDHADYSRKHGNVTLDHLFLDRVVAALSSPVEATACLCPAPNSWPITPGCPLHGPLVEAEATERPAQGEAEPERRTLVAELREAASALDSYARGFRADGYEDSAWAAEKRARTVRDAADALYRRAEPDNWITTGLRSLKRQSDLCAALNDFRDAGGSAERVVSAVVALLQDLRATPPPDTGEEPPSA